MFPNWLLDANHNAAFIIAFFGNILVIILSAKVKVREFHTYKWIISFQAAIEALVSIINVLIKYVSSL